MCVWFKWYLILCDELNVVNVVSINWIREMVCKCFEKYNILMIDGLLRKWGIIILGGRLVGLFSLKV